MLGVARPYRVCQSLCRYILWIGEPHPVRTMAAQLLLDFHVKVKARPNAPPPPPKRPQQSDYFVPLVVPKEVASASTVTLPPPLLLPHVHAELLSDRSVPNYIFFFGSSPYTHSSTPRCQTPIECFCIEPSISDLSSKLHWSTSSTWVLLYSPPFRLGLLDFYARPRLLHSFLLPPRVHPSTPHTYPWGLSWQVCVPCMGY
jgi:hypothetical protein